jgi:exosortase E/protease (VPEID-CTERM system)
MVEPQHASLGAGHRALFIALLIAAELLLLAGVFQFFVTLECHLTEVNGLCRGLRSLVARALVVFAAAVLLLWAWPGAFADFLHRAARARGRAGWMILHFLGVALLFLPLVLLPGETLGNRFHLAAWPFALGAVAASVGALGWIAGWAVWRDLVLRDRGAPLGILALAALIPDLADLVLPLWDSEALAGLTFAGVRGLLSLSGADIVADPAGRVIGVSAFQVHVARQCSGVEGVALVTGFTLLYGALFRHEIRPLRYWLTVLPVAVLASWLLNMLRIAVLIQIGAHVSPELAVNGFHSYAGWLFFTLLALGVMVAVHATPWLHRGDRAGPSTPLRQDWTAACILPLAVMLLMGIVQHAFFPHPELGYPFKVFALLAVLFVFRRLYLGLPRQLDPGAIVAGGIVGVVWLLSDTGGDGAQIAALLDRMTASDQAIWVVMRIIGTVALVPLVEELFFRGYLLSRLDRGGWGWRVLAVVLSSALFAALHGRWIAAGLAGVVLALVHLRRGRVTDAVQAHVAANLLVALGALVSGDWSRI